MIYCIINNVGPLWLIKPSQKRPRATIQFLKPLQTEIYFYYILFVLSLLYLVGIFERNAGLFHVTHVCIGNELRPHRL